MKKLSIIMVIAMLLTTFMAIVPTAAADNGEIVYYTENTETPNSTYALYKFSSDAAAAIGEDVTGDGVADVAIGRYGAEGEDGYAITWEAAFANMGQCTQDGTALKVFTLVNNEDGDRTLTSLSGVTMAWGAARAAGGVVDGNGVTLEIAAVTRIQAVTTTGANETPLTFKNVTFEYTATAGALQIQADSDVSFGEGCEIVVRDGVTTTYGVIIQSGATCYVDGAEMTFASATQANGDLRLNDANAKLIVNDGVISGQRVIYSIADNGVVVINGGTINSKAGSQNMIQVKQGKNNNVTINGGTFNYNPSLGAILTEKGSDHNIVINGGKFNGSAPKQALVRNHTATNISIYVTGGELIGSGTFIECTQAGGTVKSIDIYGGNWVSTNATTHLIAISQAVGVMNIYGGNFEAKSNKVINSTSDGNAKVTNIYGGTFKSYAWANDVAGNVGVTSATQCNIGYIYASGGAINVYGGNFYLCDANGALSDKGAHIAPFSSAYQKSTIYGGKFYGGEYALCSVAYAKADTGKDVNEATILEKYSVKTINGQALLNPTLNTGASVRLDAETSGIRFSSTISAQAVAYMAAKFPEATITYGTVITAANYLKYTNNVFTMEALDAAGRKYLNIVAENGIVENADGSLTINAAMVNIKEENYGRDFVAVPYILITTADGEEIYLYDSTNIGKTARNISEVAVSALADVQTESTGAYTNAVSEYYVYNGAARKYELTYGTAYSKYTAAEIAILKSYIVD